MIHMFFCSLRTVEATLCWLNKTADVWDVRTRKEKRGLFSRFVSVGVRRCGGNDSEGTGWCELSFPCAERGKCPSALSSEGKVASWCLTDPTAVLFTTVDGNVLFWLLSVRTRWWIHCRCGNQSCKVSFGALKPPGRSKVKLCHQTAGRMLAVGGARPWAVVGESRAGNPARLCLWILNKHKQRFCIYWTSVRDNLFIFLRQLFSDWHRKAGEY